MRIKSEIDSLSVRLSYHFIIQIKETKIGPKELWLKLALKTKRGGKVEWTSLSAQLSEKECCSTKEQEKENEGENKKRKKE